MANFQNQQESFRVLPLYLSFRIQGCWANPGGANPDDRGNPDDFLGKRLKKSNKKIGFRYDWGNSDGLGNPDESG